MATTKSTKVAAKTSRYKELKKMLEERRRELLSAVQGKIRDVRAEGGNDRDVLDQGESSEVDIQEDIELALIQMKSETLNKITMRSTLDEGLTAIASSAARESLIRGSGLFVRGPLQGLRGSSGKYRAARACSARKSALRAFSSTCRATGSERVRAA